MSRTLEAALLPLSEVRMLQFSESVPALWLGEEFASDPQLFLASVSPQWTPRVVVVRENGRVLGLLHTKERKVANFDTRVLYADSTLMSCVLSAEADRADVLHTALRFLFSRLHARAVRLLVPPEGFDITGMQQVLSPINVDVLCSDVIAYHSRLRLAPSYEEFLASLGKKTRRNFRYYRRRFEAAGGQYVEPLTMDEFKTAATMLAGKSHIPVKCEDVWRFLRMLNVIQRPVIAGLRSCDGKWLSIVGGWQGSQSAAIFLQLNNDCEHPHDSLSVVLRSYIIEKLIGQGIQEVKFWAGSSTPLARYCSPIPAVALYLDTRTRTWRYIRRVATRIGSWFASSEDLAMIAPPSMSGTGRGTRCMTSGPIMPCTARGIRLKFFQFLQR